MRKKEEEAEAEAVRKERELAELGSFFGFLDLFRLILTVFDRILEAGEASDSDDVATRILRKRLSRQVASARPAVSGQGVRCVSCLISPQFRLENP